MVCRENLQRVLEHASWACPSPPLETPGSASQEGRRRLHSACRRRSVVARGVRQQMHHRIALSALAVIATMRGPLAPLPEACDALLDRYATECYLPRSDLDEDGELFFRGGESAPECSELRTSLDVQCPRWRGAKMGRPFRVWWAARWERARQ